MAWVFLVVAGLMEMGWPIGLKFAWSGGSVRFWPAVFAVGSILGSGLFLLLAQRALPMGTAYAVWTGIGTIGTFLLGILILKEPAEPARFVCVGLIAAGIIGLKLFSRH